MNEHALHALSLNENAGVNGVRYKDKSDKTQQGNGGDEDDDVFSIEEKDDDETNTVDVKSREINKMEKNDENGYGSNNRKSEDADVIDMSNRYDDSEDEEMEEIEEEDEDDFTANQQETQSPKMDHRLQFLVQRWHKHVMEIESAAQFDEIVSSIHKPYHLMVLFTSGGKKGIVCDVCPEVDKAFKATAEGYWEELARKRQILESKLFFLRVDYDRVKSIFVHHEVFSIPQIVYFPPSDANPLLPGPFPLEWLFPVNTQAVTPSSIASFASSRSQIPVSVSSNALETFNMVVWGAIILQILKAIVSNFDVVFQKNTYILLSIGIYGVAVSGFMFSIIRGSLPFYIGQGGLAFVHLDRNNQFLLEGLFAFVLEIGCAISIWAITVYYRTKGNDDETFSGTKFAAGFFFFAFINIVLLMKYKAPWYLRMR